MCKCSKYLISETHLQIILSFTNKKNKQLARSCAHTDTHKHKEGEREERTLRKQELYQL